MEAVHKSAVVILVPTAMAVTLDTEPIAVTITELAVEAATMEAVARIWRLLVEVLVSQLKAL